jgi:ATP-binding protein involved in chromosome partitioning
VPHQLFGPPDGLRGTASRMNIDILAELPLVPQVSTKGDAGIPYSLIGQSSQEKEGSANEWNEKMTHVAETVWKSIA